MTAAPTPSPGAGPAASRGTLFIVATPIGNLSDLSPRALETLRSVDTILCEDTRTTGKLLSRWEISGTPLLAYHEHNEKAQAPRLADRLEAGETLALVSDAGTPGLSDPGFRIVRECRRRGLEVVPIPGPFAAAAALSASGLPTDAFFFAGFLPPKKAARQRFFESHKAFPHTLCLYESSHRIDKCLDDIVTVLGPDRTIAVAKELTKLHERFLVGKAGNVAERLSQLSRKGEFVVLIAPEGFEL